MICRADTMGVFQIESRAQMSMLPRLQPREFYDLVIEVAIVRPGPIQGDMVHPYLRRRADQEEVSYPERSDSRGAAQNARRAAVSGAGDAAGGRGGRLHAGRGRSTSPGDGGLAAAGRNRAVSREADRRHAGPTVLTASLPNGCFNQIRGFGEYGFPESHAASFALLVYVSAWLKHHYPAAFCAALFNSQPMGFYAPAQLVRNAHEHGVEVRPVDVNFSHWDCTIEAGAIRLGLRMIVGLPQAQAEQIVVAQRHARFSSIDDFAARSGVSPSVVTRLARADAFCSCGLDRRTSLWQTLGQEHRAGDQPLFANLDHAESPVALPAMGGRQEVFADYQTVGLSLKAHPISFYRDEMNRLGIVPAAQLANLKNGRFVRVGGLVLVRQRPGTAKGITFVTIEDETGIANLIVRMDVWERFYQVARTASAYIAHGRLQKEKEVIHVLVTKLENSGGDAARTADSVAGFSMTENKFEIRISKSEISTKFEIQSVGRAVDLLRF